MWSDRCFYWLDCDVIVISQYVCVSNHHVIHFKYVQLICQLYSIKLEGQKRKVFWGYSGCKVPMVQRRSFAESRWEFAWGCGGWGGWLSKGTEKFWSYLIELMVPQTYAKTHQVVYLNIYSSRYINYTSINLKYFKGIKKDLVLRRKKILQSSFQTRWIIYTWGICQKLYLDLLSKARLKWMVSEKVRPQEY